MIFQIEMDWLPTLSMCCDKHDICYDTCGTVKETCDKDFKKCLNKACEKLYKKGVLVAETFKSKCLLSLVKKITCMLQ